MAAGVLGAVCGLAALTMPTVIDAVVAAAIGGVGLLGLLAAGGVLGHRTAATVPEEPVGCGGCARGTGGCASAG